MTPCLQPKQEQTRLRACCSVVLCGDRLVLVGAAPQRQLLYTGFFICMRAVRFRNSKIYLLCQSCLNFFAFSYCYLLYFPSKICLIALLVRMICTLYLFEMQSDRATERCNYHVIRTERSGVGPGAEFVRT